MRAAVTEAACRGTEQGLEDLSGHSPSQNRCINLAFLKKPWKETLLGCVSFTPILAFLQCWVLHRRLANSRALLGDSGSGNSSRPWGVFVQSVSLPPFLWYMNYFGSFPAVSGDKWWQWEPIFNLHCSGCMLCSCLLSAWLSGKGFRHLPAAPPAHGRHCHSCLCPAELSLHPLHLGMHHRHPPGSSQRLPQHPVPPRYLFRCGLSLPFVVSLSSSSSGGDLSGFPLFQWMMGRGGLGK